MAATPKALVSTVYSSTATSPFTDDELTALLTVSRRNNAEAGVTGMLLYRDGRFLQALEGPEAAVRELMERIGRDTGHHSVRVLLHEEAPRRQFADWAMGFQPSDPTTRNAIPGYRSTFDDLDQDATADTESDGTALPLRALMSWFHDHPTHID